MFYYATKYVPLYGEEEPQEFVCSSNEELKEGLYVVLETVGFYFLTRVCRQIDELEVIADNIKAREVIAVVDVSDYAKAKEKKIMKMKILDIMEERSKEVKLVEQMKKYAEKDDSMRELMKQYEAL